MGIQNEQALIPTEAGNQNEHARIPAEVGNQNEHALIPTEVGIQGSGIRLLDPCLRRDEKTPEWQFY